MICNRSHDHDFTSGYRYCTKDDCVACTDDECPCNVVELLDGAAADCRKTLLALPDVHLSGFEHRAASALVHLREAWCNADPSNRPGIAEAIGAVLSTRTAQEKRDRFQGILCHGMDVDRAHEMLHEALWPRKKGGRR